MTRCVLIGAHASAEDTLTILRGNARSIILDNQHQPPRQRWLRINARDQLDATPTPLAGIIEHIPQQLDQITGIAEECGLRLNLKIDLQILLRMHA